MRNTTNWLLGILLVLVAGLILVSMSDHGVRVQSPVYVAKATQIVCATCNATEAPVETEAAQATEEPEAAAPTIVPTIPPTQAPTSIIVDPTQAISSQEDNGFRKFRKDAAWVGDDFGPEKTLPGTVTGPAIAEFKSYMGSVCGSVKVNKGETFVWPGGGAYWEAGSQLALDARWPHHKDEYINHYSDCNVYSSALDVPNPTAK